MNLEELKTRLSKIEAEIDEMDINDLEEKVYNLEEEITNEIHFSNPNEQKPLRDLLTQLNRIKKENDFYDAEAELDMMFPNRHDDDFDEDSMSYDSVFGTD